MMTGSIGRLLRLASVLALTALTVGCAGGQGPSVTAPAGYGKDPASRAARLVSYCDRLAEKGEMVTALGLCARAHEINPDDPETLMKIASLLTSMNRKQAAVQAYNALLERHPRHHEARYSLGKLYMETGELAMASVQFNHAIATDPTDPRAYNAIGILNDQAGEHETAQALYRTALQHDPTNISVRNNLGLSLALNGKRDEAIEVLAQLAVDEHAGSGTEQTVLRNLEAAYAAQGGTAKAPMSMIEPPEAVAPPVAPVSSVPLEEPLAGPPSEPGVEPTAVKAADEAPPTPAEGAPTPLFIPPGARAGEPDQTGPLETPPAAVAPPNSVILAAAAQLMQPPAWADFEPGALIQAEPPPEAAPEPLPQDEALDAGEQNGVPLDIAPEVDPMEIGSVTQPGEQSLSMLMIDSTGATV